MNIIVKDALEIFFATPKGMPLAQITNTPNLTKMKC
jgi:hypothetical protein